MLTFLADFEDVFGPFRLLRSITLRTLMASGTALIIGFVIGPWLIARLQKISFIQTFRDADEIGHLAERHAAKRNTPTMGGLLIYAAVAGSTLLWARPNIWVLVSLFVYTAMTGLGLRDDYLKISKQDTRGVSFRGKLLWQSGITAVTLAALLMHPESSIKVRELWVPFLKVPLWENMPLLVLGGFFLFMLVGSSNAINLTDGIDGLAIGCTITVALSYAIMAYAAGHSVIANYLLISYIPGVGELTVVCGSLVGGGLAFLWFNSHPAEVFMGDTGSLALGGLIGTIAIIVHQPLTLGIVGGIFVIEALSVIIQVGSFKTRGKRIFRMAPVHHHYELKGWAESKVVIRFWILSLIFALAGLGTLKLR
jgi:phospho-N-acetylmuramoyl-pentapeptide-transferase